MRRTILAAAMVMAATAWAGPRKRHPHRPPRPPAATPAPTPPPPAATSPSEAPADAAAAPTATPAEASPATPAPTPPPPPPPSEAPPSRGAVDLESLNREYDELRDELFRSRAKAHLLGDALFKTRIVARFKYEAQRAWPLKKVTLKIDDQPVFTADAPSTADPLQLYDGFAAPGRHTLALRVECGAVGEDRVGYATEGSFLVDVVDDKQTKIDFVVDESGDGPKKLAEKHEGSFDVRIKADVETQERTK